MKDPLLASYTMEELMYEYLDHTSRNEAAEEVQEQKQEEAESSKYDEALRWAEEEEAKDKARIASKLPENTQEKNEPSNPINSLTPEDVKWMEEQLLKEKTVLGDDFGEDFSGEF